MRSAAKELEFERAAALRDEIQQIRLRVLEQDAVDHRRAGGGTRGARAAVSSARPTGSASAARGRGAEGPAMFEVTSVTVLPADEEPAANARRRKPGIDENTAADWLPGIRDEHDDDGTGWQARWLDRPTWDRTVTPNVRRRTGTRPGRRRLPIDAPASAGCPATRRLRSRQPENRHVIAASAPGPADEGPRRQLQVRPSCEAISRVR